MNTASHLRRNKAPCSKGFQTSFSEFMIQPPCRVKISQFGPRTFCSQQYIFGWKERSQFIQHYYFSIITCWYISSPITDACLVSIKMSKKLVISLTCNVKLLKKKKLKKWSFTLLLSQCSYLWCLYELLELPSCASNQLQQGSEASNTWLLHMSIVSSILTPCSRKEIVLQKEAITVVLTINSNPEFLLPI